MANGAPWPCPAVPRTASCRWPASPATPCAASPRL